MSKKHKCNIKWKMDNLRWWEDIFMREYIRRHPEHTSTNGNKNAKG